MFLCACAVSCVHFRDLGKQCCMYYAFISRISYAVLNLLHVPSGEQGMVDEAQKALEEAEALKKVFNF